MSARGELELFEDQRDSVASYCGLRLGELLALRWRDVDWTGSALTISRSLSSGIEGPTKSGHIRRVPLADQPAAAPVTRPSRIASDLLYEHEDPEGVAQLIADSIRHVYDYPGTFADSLAPHAQRFGLRRGDGLGLLRWFLELVGDPDTAAWMKEARGAPRARHRHRASAESFNGRVGSMTARGPYKTPAAFRRALTDKLRDSAKDSSWGLPQLQRQMA